MWAEFCITDGTDRVDLISKNSGFHLDTWTPQVADLKDGGVWRDSPLSDGRYPVMAKLANATETLTLTVNGYAQNAVIRDTIKMRRLLQKARNYWMSRAVTEPVWIERRASCEAIKGYSVIMNARAGHDSNPFFGSFMPVGDIVAMDDFDLIIEREPTWRREQPGNPGTLTAVPLSAVETYNGVNFGNVDDLEVRDPTTADEVFVANKRNTANFTHVFRDDGGAFSANLVGAALPYQLLPAVPAVNDAAYFLIATGVANSGPFSNVVLDLSGGSDVTITWEIYNGGWITIPTSQDRTQNLSAVGVCAFSFSQVTAGSWTPVAVNGVVSFAIRARVSAIGGAPVGAVQNNRNPYTCNWPYIEVQDSVLKGDHPAAIRLRIRSQSGDGTPTMSADRVICGARKVSRGDAFTAYLNVADEQNPAGVTVAIVGADTSFIDDVEEAATGRCGQWNPGVAALMDDRFSITLSNAIASDFHGRFHVYLRTNLGGAGMAVQVRALMYGAVTNQYWESRTKAIEINLAPYPVDMGEVELPPGDADSSETLESIVFMVRASTTVAAALLFQELILIPTDEWIAQTEETASLGATHLMTILNYLDLDGAGYPKYLAYSPVRNRSTGNLEVTYRATSPVPPQIEANERVRIWFLFCSQNNFGDAVKIAWPHLLHSVQLSAVQRYDSMIGDGGL